MPVLPNSIFFLVSFESRGRYRSYDPHICTVIRHCIRGLHLLYIIFIMICEVYMVHTVCCVAPPGTQNKMRYQLSNRRPPPSNTSFRAHILRFQNNKISERSLQRQPSMMSILYHRISFFFIASDA